MWNTYIASAAASRNVRLSAGVRGVSYVGGRGGTCSRAGDRGDRCISHRSRVHSFAEQGGESVDIPPGIVQF